jgi:putative NIF3 family GTP cyclohydrolase 1 type 2
MGLILLGHYASERFAVEELAEVLSREFANVTVWPSRDERDPLERV